MYISFQQVAADGTVKTVSSLTVPAKAHGAELQADSNNIRYTMDSATDPSSSSGMLLLTTEPPKYFLIEDIRRIRFTQGAGAAKLNIHYIAGRDI